jgi:4-alpha-glucanotransferase
MATSGRAAGILLHISSLPSKSGIGDLGDEAFRFADFLQRSGQTFWQILPLSPITSDQAWSPYSSCSTMAGNILFISLDYLVAENILSRKDLITYPTGIINFARVSEFKLKVLKKAYGNRTGRKNDSFHLFCKKESWWLDDFAMYMVLKSVHENEPWYRWPQKIRSRERQALARFAEEHAAEIDREKWYQYIFHTQWMSLKHYCNNMGIRIIGDLPFYVAHDSADVWANQEIFRLKRNGEMLGVAGVPPDYFNDEGQLWGMPVYNREVLKKDKYDWWVSRLRKNIEVVDYLRLDHFRAFAAFWEVPASHKNAIKGKWKQGPGDDLFRILKNTFGPLPFIAEDLGDVDESVFSLRDKYNLPGMKVLQFGFGDNIAVSDHIPHNYGKHFIAYTGTHDNNTTRGWYRRDMKREGRKRINNYFGGSVTEQNIHDKMTRLAFGSVADVAIIPMQDLLGLDEKARMNVPSSTKGNWTWRMPPAWKSGKLERWLLNLTQVYGRVQA